MIHQTDNPFCPVIDYKNIGLQGLLEKFWYVREPRGGCICPGSSEK